jgi:LmbE family N-acetylglucosaminyl deacetylase
MNKNITVKIDNKDFNFSSKLVEKFFLFTSLIVLIATTTYWALLSAKIESFNSDQISAPYLFSSFKQVMSASLTGSHTYLVKWPLFWLIKLYSYSHWAYYLTTLFCVLVTILCLAYLIIKLEKRPLYSGIILLSISSVLLLIPAQSYPGSLLPLNMGMLTTRNIEYVMYIAAIYLAIKSRKFISINSLLSVAILILLFVSDRMFLALGLGGSILAIATLISRKNWKLISDLDKWFWYSLFSTVFSYILLGIFISNNFIHRLASSGLGYYSPISSFKNLALGFIYSITGTFANFGANTAYYNLEIKKLPHEILHSFFGISTIPTIVNLCVFGIIIFSIVKLFRNKGYFDSESTDNRVLLVLLFSSLSGYLVFILTNHYYPVDARYLSIVFFVGFISLSHYSRSITISEKLIGYITAVLIVSISIGLFSFWNNYATQLKAYDFINRRDVLAVSAIKSQKINYVVGNYWRIYHIKYLYGQSLEPYPDDLCNNSTTKTIGSDLKSKAFVYLLSYDKNLTGESGCKTDKIVDAIGNPNRTLLIDGSIARPNELLLTYQHGINLKKNNLTPDSLSTILPADISSLDFNCGNPNTLNIVAHEDDDLLFINPKIIDDFNSNRCVKTIYLTAGDAGSGLAYWTVRQNGAENAYSYMIGYKGSWINRTVKIADNEYVTVATPRVNSKAMLIFFNLPDGGMNGQGFKNSNYQNLSKLLRGSISSIDTVDKQSKYSLNQLESALEILIRKIQPIIIRTQSRVNSFKHPDHSDHQAVSAIVSETYTNYEKDQFQSVVKIPIYYYAGYPVYNMSRNVFGLEYDQKISAFLAYALYDKAVCGTIAECSGDLTYGSFLPKNYEYNY